MQSKKQSLVEASTNTGIGLLVSLVTSYAFVWAVGGVRHDDWSILAMTGFMTLVSIIRSYTVRRVFNRDRNNNNNNKGVTQC